MQAMMPSSTLPGNPRCMHAIGARGGRRLTITAAAPTAAPSHVAVASSHVGVRKLSDAELLQFERDGFVVLRGLLPADTVRRVGKVSGCVHVHVCTCAYGCVCGVAGGRIRTRDGEAPNQNCGRKKSVDKYFSVLARRRWTASWRQGGCEPFSTVCVCCALM